MLTPSLSFAPEVAFPLPTASVIETVFVSQGGHHAFSGSNLVSIQNSTNNIRVFSGFSSTVASSLAFPAGSSCITVVGGNLVVGNIIDDTITVYDGLSNSSLSSFSFNNPDSLTSVNGNLVATSSSSTLVTFFEGVTSTVDRTIDTGEGQLSVAYDGARLYTGKGTTLNIHEGTTATIADTLTLPESVSELAFLGGNLVFLGSSGYQKLGQ